MVYVVDKGEARESFSASDPYLETHLGSEMLC